jgi:hypothetical protein
MALALQQSSGLQCRGPALPKRGPVHLVTAACKRPGFNQRGIVIPKAATTPEVEAFEVGIPWEWCSSQTS